MADADKKEADSKPPGGDKIKRDKVGRMSLQEIDIALEKVNKHMGGFQSRYARALLSRKRFLQSQ
ncbi:MAG: hypothetical protein NC930_04610 [Candidatus Omnitrophica bacterium]|nr:hypothetical protein [Candidatus Omnitrophota bacterium]